MSKPMPPDALAARQRAAIKTGREAEAAGRRVIYIHGRPYADPGDDAEADAHGESPFPWDLWDGDRPA